MRIFLVLLLTAGVGLARVPVWPLEPGGGGGGSGTVTSVGATSANAGLVIGGSPIATSGTFTFTLDADLAQIGALADPNADRGLFWDDSAGAYAFLEFGSGLTLTGTTLTAASLGDGDKGDITVTSTGTVWTIDTQAVTLAKLQNIATSTFIGRTTAGTGVPEELSVATAKTMLGLTGTNSGDVTLTGSLDYLTLAGQAITVGPIDLTTDTTGLLAGVNVSFSDPDSNFTSTTVDGALAEFDDVDGNGPNSATGKVDWTQIAGMPADFADGTDDGSGGGGADADAIHDNVSGEIAAITEKTLPVGADLAVIEDSAASNAKKRIQLANLETLLEAVMDLNQLQGAITDAQVPDTITINTANSGDSATAFFTTGQIERARGGTGADTSAYGDGLIGSLSAGTTADIDTLTELETAIGGVDILAATEIDTLAELNTIITNADLVPQATTLTIAGTTNEITSSAGAQDLSTNRTWTLSLPATIDLGGKTSFELPNAAAPTVDAFGELAGDSNLWGTNKGAPIFYDGTAAVALIGTLVSDTPLDGQVPRFNSTGTTITWETFSADPGGSDTQLQYNDGGVLNGTSGVTYNDVTGVLTVGTISTTTLNATAHRILDNVDQSHALNIIAAENLTSDISLNLDLDGATRNLNITGNTTISGTNTGDQTITLTGEVTGTGTGSFATTIADSVSVTGWTLTTPTISGAITFPDDVRQTFNPGTTNAGINVGSLAGDPSTPSNGDLWYDSTANELSARINGATVALGAGGGGGVTDATYLVATDHASLSADIAVGATPGGELGGTWTAPTHDDGVTVDAWVMGASTATTPAANDNDTSLATTAYVQSELTGYASDTVTFTNKTLTAPVMTAPVLGTPASGTLTNATGLPISTGVSGLGTGVATFLATPSFTNLSTAVTGDTLAGSASTNTFTNKTLDAAGTGNVVKFKSFPQFTSPNNVDGTGCTIGTTSTAVGYGRAVFSNSADQNVNYCQFRILVPADWDTAVTPRVRLIDMTGGADTATRAYVIGVGNVAVSGSATAATSNGIAVNMAADAGGASGDINISSTTTLTGWGTAVTPGNMMIITVARDGNDGTLDASTVNSTLIGLEIEYGATQ